MYYYPCACYVANFDLHCFIIFKCTAWQSCTSYKFLSEGKAWSETSQEVDVEYNNYYGGIDAWKRGMSFSRYLALLTLRFWQLVEAKINTMGCWIKQKGLYSLPIA